MLTQTTDTGMAVLGAVSASGAVPEDMRVTVFAPSDAAFQAALQALSAQSGAAVTPGAEELAAARIPVLCLPLHMTDPLTAFIAIPTSRIAC